MKKVALLGDSIRLFGYGKYVPALLREKANVFQPKENCKFAKKLLRMIFDYKDELKNCDVIHFNCGLWDVADIVGDGELFSTDAEYTKTVLRIAKALKTITPNVIFATTTPVNPDYRFNKNEDIDRFNALVVPCLEKINVRINDLHSLIAEDVESYICNDWIHLTEKGAKLCAIQVSKIIMDEMNK